MKSVLITGAASGIGLALATVCLKKGFTVILVDKNEAKLQIESTHLKEHFPNAIHSYVCDITNLDKVQQLVNSVKKEVISIDWIFNNAGIMGTVSPIWEQEITEIHTVMDVNIFGMIHMIKCFMPFLFEQQHPSHIINMASLYAVCSGSQVAPYSMSKHAVLALSESLYFDLRRLQKPVEVSVVLPSFTDTALLSPPPSREISTFHHALNNLLSHSRPAMDVATFIVREVEQKKFYIIPDTEVKGYCEERTKAIVKQEEPYVHNIEKLMRSLYKRSQKS